MSKTNELAVKKETAVAVFDESIFDGMGIGNEEIVAAQYKMPLLKIVEPLSKALIEGEALYIAGATVGDIIDTAIGEVVGKEIEFLPVKAMTLYIEKDKDDKTIAKHESRAILEKTKWRNENGKKKGTFLDNDNEIQETIYIYGLNITSGGDWCAIPFNRGRLPAAQTLLMKLNKQKMDNGARAPFMYRVWAMKPEAIKSADGKPFRTWKATPADKINEREDGAHWLGEAKALWNALAEKNVVIVDSDADTVGEEHVPF